MIPHYSNYATITRRLITKQLARACGGSIGWLVTRFEQSGLLLAALLDPDNYLVSGVLRFE